MDLRTLRTLPSSDQRVFLLGRITAETTSVDAALRFVHAALRGRHEIDAYLDAPRYITTIVKECKALLATHDSIDETGRRAVNATLTAANKMYTSRNRFIHDMLRADLLSGGWELAGLERQPDGEQNITATTFDGMVGLVEDLVGVTWRLRGAALYILNGSWSGLATGAVEGQWDGSADYVN
ncbi:hypothetical protein [Curtobacterium sp. MCBA15_013]|uniref:hypothetical protein n=1 Tax=Curtobacterium sp. MCBA15_013 TaxID=1898739 RepID=UPI0008DD0214|nr:hypothetical protein [Curtobacterium sp. MCBA15_013]OII18439.1 hypothetical protein BIV01_02530 [Curtobacterium sp. MCBA15_013]